MFLFGVLVGILCATLTIYSPPSSTSGLPTDTPPDHLLLNASATVVDSSKKSANSHCIHRKTIANEAKEPRRVSPHVDGDDEPNGGGGTNGTSSIAVAFGARAVRSNWSATLCPAAQFQVYEGVDYNQGPDFDLDALHRNGPGASRFAPHSFAKTCSFDEYEVLKAVHVKEEGLEAKHHFLARCMDKCIGSNECTGFVVRGDVCYLKRLMPFLAVTREPQLVSFVRSAPPSGFPKSPAADAPPSKYEPVKFDTHFRSRVLFGVLGNAAQAHERLLPALSTWLCEWDAMILLEDNPVARALVKTLKQPADGAAAIPSSPPRTSSSVPRRCLTGKQFVFEDEPRDSKLRAFNGAWKNLPLARLMVETHGRNSSSTQPRDWFAIVDDDTFLLSHNFNVFFNSVVEQLYSPQRDAVSVGVVFTDGKVSFVQGGAGIFLSAEAIHRIAANYSTCLTKCVTWAGDIRLGCCYPLVGVTMVPYPVFFSVDIVKIQQEDATGRPPAALIPITFHQLKTRSFIVAAYNAEQLALGRPLFRSGLETNRRSGTALVQCVVSDEKQRDALFQTPQVPLHCADPFLRFDVETDDVSNTTTTSAAVAVAADNAQQQQPQSALKCGALSPSSFISWPAFSFALRKFECT